MNDYIESFWDKDLRLHYDVCVGIGLIGGQTFNKALNDAESVRKYLKLDFSIKSEFYYRKQYIEYLKRRLEKDQIEKNRSLSNDCLSEKIALAGDLISTIVQKDFDNDPDVFHQSLQAVLNSTYSEYLVQRSLSSIYQLQTFKVKKANAGFALAKKEGSSDLMLAAVFNQSGIPGLGTKLMISAIDLGARYLECFGSYLNCYFQSYRFEVYSEILNVKMHNGSFQTVYCMEHNRFLAADDGVILRFKKEKRKDKSFEEYYTEVVNNKLFFKYVPEKYKTEELLGVIKHFNGILKYIPYKLKTYERCFDAIKRNRFDLNYVPRKYKTVELCLAALEHCGNSCLRYMPKVVRMIISPFPED